MGIDLGIKIPAVAYVAGSGACFFGNGRYQRHMRRRFYARRRALQKAGKKRALRKSQGKERRWMKNINHQLSRQIVNHAQEKHVRVIKLESLTGIREGTTRQSRGASARKNNRMSNTWSFSQLSQFITYKAERLGITVEQVDPAYTSQECPPVGYTTKLRIVPIAARRVAGKATGTQSERLRSVSGLALLVTGKVPPEPVVLPVDGWPETALKR